MRAGEALGVRDGAGLGDDLQARLVVDQQPQPLTDDGVIVGDDDGGLVAVGPLGIHGSGSGGGEHLVPGPVDAIVAVMHDDVGRARAPRLAHGRALRVRQAGVLGQRSILAFALDVPAAEAVGDDVQRRGGDSAGPQPRVEYAGQVGEQRGGRPRRVEPGQRRRRRQERAAVRGETRPRRSPVRRRRSMPWNSRARARSSRTAGGASQTSHAARRGGG